MCCPKLDTAVCTIQTISCAFNCIVFTCPIFCDAPPKLSWASQHFCVLCTIHGANLELKHIHLLFNENGSQMLCKWNSDTVQFTQFSHLHIALSNICTFWNSDAVEFAQWIVHFVHLLCCATTFWSFAHCSVWHSCISKNVQLSCEPVHKWVSCMFCVWWSSQWHSVLQTACHKHTLLCSDCTGANLPSGSHPLHKCTKQFQIAVPECQCVLGVCLWN